MRAVAKPSSTRVFTNPKIRLPIPVEMPEPALTANMHGIEEMLKHGLAVKGLTLKDVTRINIAYPHKHPGLFPGHLDAAREVAEKLQKRLGTKYPHIEWRLAHEIYETVHLDRSRHCGYFHAVTGRQEYVVEYPPETPPPFAASNSQELFVLADWTMKSGSTMANLMSFIHHNGGYVVGMLTDENYESFKQRNGNGSPRFKEAEARIKLSDVFNDESRNNGRLKELGYELCIESLNEKKPTSPDQCLHRLQKALNACGNSLFSLTDREVIGLMTAHSYTGLLKSLRRVARERKAGAPCL
jgi:hypothetical protein